MQLISVSLAKIAVPRRVRCSRDVDESFLFDIRTKGILVPLIVCPSSDKETFILVHGLRRLIAASMIGFKTVDVLVDEDISSKDILSLETTYNMSERYTLAELADLARHFEKTRKLSTPSEFDRLLGLFEGNYLKLKAILEYTDSGEGDLEKILSDNKSDVNFLIEKAYKKMERDRKKKEKEGEEEISDDHSEFVEDYGDDYSCNLDEPEIPQELLNYIMVRDEHTCSCQCGVKGEVYDSIFKGYALKNPIFGGVLEENNLVTVCPNCVSLIIQYALGNLMMKEEEKEKMRYIIKLGEQLKKDISSSDKPREYYKDYFKKSL